MHPPERPGFRQPGCLALLLLLCLLWARPAGAGIAFEEATEAAGIRNAGRTFGASWGDFDGDGLPDLWVGNHGRTPSLYRNQGDGTFQDIADRVWPGPMRDTHGAAWADFDGDGDQDLLETVGGTGSHHLWVNEGGRFQDRAAAWNVASPGARGRDALWVDADRDGRLDLVLSHAFAPNLASQVLLRRDAGFADATADAGWDLLSTLYTQLADLDGDGDGEIVVWGPSFPRRVYDLPLLPGAPLAEIRSALGFPLDSDAFAMDSAIADLDGDLRQDVFVVKQRHNAQLAQVSSNRILARINAISDERGLSFRSSSPIWLDVYPTGILNGTVTADAFVRIGAARMPATDFSLNLDPSDPRVFGLPAHDPGEEGLWIGFEPSTATWTLLVSSSRSIAVNLQIDSGGSIQDATAIGIPAVMRDPQPNVYLAGDSGYVESRGAAGLEAGFACASVVAGDFDNDMDVDLYLACNHPVVNTPNVLLENLGAARFRVVPDAGGAAGSTAGRADVVVMADYDLDGFLDLFVTNGEGDEPTNAGPHQLFRNAGNGNHWLEIDLDGGPGNATGRGAEVVVTAGGRPQVGFQGGGHHRRAQNAERLHFGLGPNASADVRVRWPSGRVTNVAGAAADRILRVGPPSPVPELPAEVAMVLGGALGWSGRRRRRSTPSPRGSSAVAGRRCAPERRTRVPA